MWTCKWFNFNMYLLDCVGAMHVSLSSHTYLFMCLIIMLMLNLKQRELWFLSGKYCFKSWKKTLICHLICNMLLCRLPALAEATYRDHFCRLASSSSSSAAASASQKISVTFFSGTTQASFVIFGTEHQYGELYRVMHFWICGMSTSCFTWLWILWT